jgi:hypothetical protein
MKKIKLLIADSNLIKPWFMPLWQEYFDVAVYNHDQTYDPASVVLTDNRFGEKERYQQIRQHNYRIVLPYLMDSDIEAPCKVVDGELILRARDWMWIQESLQWRYLNYHTPGAPSVPNKFFLLLMNLKRSNRDDLLQAVGTYLQSSTYSYVERGITLPEDIFVHTPFHAGNANDRLYVSNWYAQTCFSMVSESFIKSDLFISEKIFKPLAYHHPLIVYGTPGTLAHIRSLGFETFGHRIDESYDSIPNDSAITAFTRLGQILQALEDLYTEFTQTGVVFQDDRTKQILAHNHALFFNQKHIQDLFRQQVVDPVREFVES